MLFVSTSATYVLCVHSLYVIAFNFLIQFHHIEENNTLQRQKQMITARIQSRTIAATKKLTIETITAKRAKQPDIPEAEAEVCTIPVARYVNFVDLTTSSTRRKTPRWSPQNHIRPQKLQSNSLLNVFASSDVNEQCIRAGPRIINGIRFQTIQELTRLIRENPDNLVLDSSECECPTCPYSTGCLATQRYVLLERCYQIENVFQDRPELYGKAGVGESESYD